jgi:hypothetical protein
MYSTKSSLKLQFQGSKFSIWIEKGGRLVRKKKEGGRLGI